MVLDAAIKHIHGFISSWNYGNYFPLELSWCIYAELLHTPYTNIPKYHRSTGSAVPVWRANAVSQSRSTGVRCWSTSYSFLSASICSFFSGQSSITEPTRFLISGFGFVLLLHGAANINQPTESFQLFTVSSLLLMRNSELFKSVMW